VRRKARHRPTVAGGDWLPHFLRAPPTLFRSVDTQLRNRLAYMTTREHSPSDHLCQIVPVKCPFMNVGLQSPTRLQVDV
jgi:hypothetical protein